MKTHGIVSLAGIAAAAVAFAPADVGAEPAAQRAAVEKSKSMVPAPPWPKGDQRGMANGIGAGTYLRCAYHLNNPAAKSYEISHLRSNTMPMSPLKSAPTPAM